MDEPQFYKVRSVLQTYEKREVITKIDFYSLQEDKEDYIEDSFITATRHFYEAAKFKIISVNQKAISEAEYLDNTD